MAFKKSTFVAVGCGMDNCPQIIEYWVTKPNPEQQALDEGWVRSDFIAISTLAKADLWLCPGHGLGMTARMFGHDHAMVMALRKREETIQLAVETENKRLGREASF